MLCKTTAKILLLIAAVSLSACDLAVTQDQKIRKQVREMLIDSDSAKFGEIRPGTDKDSYCGTVNAKNRMGGYTGSTLFLYEKVYEDIGTVTIAEDPPSDYDFRRLKGNSDFSSHYSKLYSKCRTVNKIANSCAGTTPSLPDLCKLMLVDGKEGQKAFIDEIYRRFD